MAVKASASITLSSVIDVKATYRYYLLQSSTLSTPSKPTVYPPGGNWNDTEPSYTDGSTNSLYFVDCTVFCDDTFTYSKVSKSSSYEAAKVAYNKAVNAQNSANENAEKIEYHTEVISDHSARISQNETDIKLKVESSEFESYKATVDGDIIDLGSRMVSAESDISVMQGSIALKVEQTDIDTAINSLEIEGRNLLVDSESTRGYLINSAGELEASYVYMVVTPYIKVVPGVKYTFSRKSGNPDFFRYSLHDSDKNFVSRVAITSIPSGGEGSYTLTIPSGIYYIRISYQLDTYAKFEKGDKRS